MEVISPIMFSLSLLFTRPTFTPFQIITTTAWLIHYVNRSMIYPYRATSMAPIHILPFLLSIFFSVINGYTNGMWIGRHSNSIYQGQFWIGMIIWAGGFLSNVYHDNLLFKLRVKNAAKQQEQEQKQDKKKRYFVPTGGLFEYISCPNYFSESVEWLGYSIATGSSFPAWIFLISTAANLWPRAYRTHQWYKNEFRNYPKERKAVIPFIY
jgi:3-oxo-5-alpha-steroid 4-dehydrogenase 1